MVFFLSFRFESPFLVAAFCQIQSLNNFNIYKQTHRYNFLKLKTNTRILLLNCLNCDIVSLKFYIKLNTVSVPYLFFFSLLSHTDTLFFALSGSLSRNDWTDLITCLQIRKRNFTIVAQNITFFFLSISIATNAIIKQLTIQI